MGTHPLDGVHINKGNRSGEAHIEYPASKQAGSTAFSTGSTDARGSDSSTTESTLAYGSAAFCETI